MAEGVTQVEQRAAARRLAFVLGDDCGLHADAHGDGLLAPVARAAANFCLVDPVLKDLVPSLYQCVASGLAFGCHGLRFLINVELGGCLADTLPALQRAQDQILAPLTPRQRTEFMRLLQVLVTQNNDMSRAPAEVAGR